MPPIERTVAPVRLAYLAGLAGVFGFTLDHRGEIMLCSGNCSIMRRIAKCPKRDNPNVIRALLMLLIGEVPALRMRVPTAQ